MNSVWYWTNSYYKLYLSYRTMWVLNKYMKKHIFNEVMRDRYWYYNWYCKLVSIFSVFNLIMTAQDLLNILHESYVVAETEDATDFFGSLPTGSSFIPPGCPTGIFSPWWCLTGGYNWEVFEVTTKPFEVWKGPRELALIGCAGDIVTKILELCIWLRNLSFGRRALDCCSIWDRNHCYSTGYPRNCPGNCWWVPIFGLNALIVN